MLKQISVNGFKSLTNFTFEISPGLNVLVGPNGAGKSNIILFFEFLSHLVNASAMHATSRVGGAGAIFTLLPDGYLNSDILFDIRGSAKFKSRYKRKKNTLEEIDYKYSANIRLSSGLDNLSFTRQSIEIKPANKAEGKDGGISIHWTENNEGKVKVDANFSDLHFVVPFFPGGEEDKHYDLNDFILKVFGDELRDYSIVQVLKRFVEPIGLIHDDLVEGRAYNINPSKVRQPEDIATEPGIEFDGSGLAATLFYSGKKAHSGQRLHPYLPVVNERIFSEDLKVQVERYARLINENIVRLEVVSSPYENKLRVSLFQRALADVGETDIPIPISLASDGTVKWLALTTAVLSSASAFAIEEPENFLHPYMQTEIVELVRKKCASEKGRMFALMTTHSETLLNALEPHEVIVVSMVDSETKAIRPGNAGDLKREISSTGFGLGYYYIAGALE